MKKLLKILSLITFMFSFELIAESNLPKVSEKPLAMMQKLSILSGKWLARTDITEDNGKSWQQGKPKLVEFSFKQRGMLLEEMPIDIDKQGFHMQTYISYDQYRDVFRKAAIDDVWGIMDLYQGKIIDNQLVLDNLDAETFFPIGPNTWRGFRLTLELKANNRWLYIDKTDDKGSSWQPAFRVYYQKIKN
ncbi:hypothetical protein tinsulaeT_13610 [Thalassotalea insulae]|uniref:DUF1579 domain-containing protein n=1 Tax=Thalassotalea insulae TaxID=2056778 RepID=A0ABQ6GV32_9GAMM|nr:hypothetical protein [Thalassotalea insulae]GLX78021.1 hypothetical protein tinsulaeT_13610 [Thalassotalea insulae]